MLRNDTCNCSFRDAFVIPEKGVRQNWYDLPTSFHYSTALIESYSPAQIVPNSNIYLILLQCNKIVRKLTVFSEHLPVRKM